ncbi:MAG TPA: CoA transferase [Dehalococcoidia bacterium]|jgi:crotonobetainyl-CoA:carnitine CoA-transferase CaiB-like acyl-CoA transferase
MSALGDLRVLDLSTGVAGPFCGRLLTGFGADVLKIEPPGGEEGRALPPLFDGEIGPERSAFFRWLNAGKRMAELSLGSLDGTNELRRLAQQADLVLESFGPGHLDRLFAGYHELSRLNPGLIMVSLSPFGQEGPWRDVPLDDLTAYALSGWADLNGRPGREPLKGSGYQASFQAGISAFIATLGALFHRDRTGEGQQVDVSLLDATVASFAPALLAAQYEGEPLKPRPPDFTGGPVPAADGYFALTLSRGHFWRDAMNELGLPDLAFDERFYEPSYRQQHAKEVASIVEERIAKRGVRELFDALARLRVVCGMVLSTADLYANEHVAARGFMQPLSRPDGGSVPAPGAPFRMSRTPWREELPSAHLGEHNRTALAEPPPWRQSVSRPVMAPPYTPSASAGAERRGPLGGVRCVVLTQAWAGTFATELLGLLGADVIQIEALSRPDSWRGGYGGRIRTALRPIPTAVHPWNCSSLYNSVNLNKRALTLDLSRPEGIETFRRLVLTADVVAENFTPRVMGNLGIDYAALRRLRPDIILLSMSAYGATGPYANIPGIGGTIEPMSGMSSLLGYPDGPPLNSGQMYPDPVAGYFGAAAVLLALHERERTGEGQYIDLSMQETSMTFIADALLEYAANGRVRPRMGNRHPTLAPHNVYPCRDGRWIAISAGTDGQFGGLAAASSYFEWPDDPRFATAEARKQHEDELDALIARWTATQDGFALEERLRRQGVPAAVVRNAQETLQLEQLRQRGMLVEVTHPETGTHLQAAAPWRLSRTPGGVRRNAPCLGEHGREVLTTLLGLSDAAYNRLEALGVAGTEPPS